MINKVKLVVADAQAVFREGIKSLLSIDESIEWTGEADNTIELERILRTEQPDILILDLDEQTFLLNEVKPLLLQYSTKVILVTNDNDNRQVERNLNLRIYSYLTKGCGKHEILKAVHAAIKGEKFFCSDILSIMLDNKIAVEQDVMTAKSCLSERELEIALLISNGLTNKLIAEQISLSPHTVHTHRKNIMKKLQVHSAIEIRTELEHRGLLV